MKQDGKLVRATNTQYFRVKDVGFKKNGKIISSHEALSTLLEADSATLKLRIRKIG